MTATATEDVRIRHAAGTRVGALHSLIESARALVTVVYADRAYHDLRVILADPTATCRATLTAVAALESACAVVARAVAARLAKDARARRNGGAR